VDYLDRPLTVARDIFRTGAITRGTKEQAALILKDFLITTREYDIPPQRVRLFNTNILSEARNHEIFLNRLQVTTGLTAIALQAIGVDARSWQGWQVPIITDQAHGKARVESIDGAALIERMQQGQVPVVAGFQGIDPKRNRITTLGRGGSDLSAVAIAAAVKADRCDIYTDVDGIYTTDPRIVPRARKLERISYEEMLELASVGAKVLQTRSVELAMKQRVRVQVLSSFIDESAPPADSIPGTMIVSDDELEGTDMERQLITGIAADKNEAKVTLTRVADRPGAVAAIFGPLAEASSARKSASCRLPLACPRM
jgi:aspartate kinase